MQKSIDDYNGMFGTNYKIDGINAYNRNLNERLARKDKNIAIEANSWIWL